MSDESEFFTPIEFPTEVSPAEQKPKFKVEWDENHIADAKRAIDREVAKLRVGTSKLRTGAVDNGKFGTPCENAIKTFIAEPSDFTFDRVKELATQDYGQRVGDHFVSLLKKARREVPNE
jgi:hypothetical protein